MVVPFTAFGIAVALLIAWAIKEKRDFVRKSSGERHP